MASKHTQAIRSIVTTTPTAVAQESILKDLRALAAQAQRNKQQTTDYIQALKASLEDCKS